MTSRSARTSTALLALIAAISITATGCTTSTPQPTAASSSSNSALLPTPAGTVPDGIEDINSSKDMTGVITTYSDADNPKNPYFDLIPNVCPFLPDTLTKNQLGLEEKTPASADNTRCCKRAA